MQNDLVITGARQHNLRNLSVHIPRGSLTVVTGLSGSGKSSLAFDTLYAEGQRRYVESLSAYARQFLERLQKPEVDRIDGLSPAIAVEQRSAGSNPRSIVATTTEIHDYLRLLYAHVGRRHCPRCGQPVAGLSSQAVADRLLALPGGRRLILLAPCVHEARGDHAETLARLRRDGFTRARIDGTLVALEDEPKLARTRPHRIEAVVDRLVTGGVSSGRLADSVELALRVGNGTLVSLVEDPDTPDGWHETTISERPACKACNLSFDELLPRDFSFNSPYGACPACNGLGTRMVFTPEAVVPDPSLPLRKGAIPLLRWGPRRLIIHYNRMLRQLAAHLGFDLDTPWRDLPTTVTSVLLNGSGDTPVPFEFWRRGRKHSQAKPFEGFIPHLSRRYVETESEAVRERLRQSMTPELCPGCQGARLRPESLAVTVGGLSLAAFCEQSVAAARGFVAALSLAPEEQQVARELLKEIGARLAFLDDVGLGYLTLARSSATLSGGEAQRIRLATQLGSGLVGVIYVLDEPTIGLHPRDNLRLLHSLEQLRDAGNTVVVVEHDLETIRRADWVIDLGPGAGRQGGELVCAGTPAAIAACEASPTGQYLSGRRQVPLPAERRRGNGNVLRIVGAAEHNLKDLTVDIPLGTFCCVTGVSGSGKSTLVEDVLMNALWRHLGVKAPPPGRHRRLEGADRLGQMIVIDQSPIGRTPRSNPITYTGTFDAVRALFARLPDARARGYRPARFSFNVKGGRCEECKGDGVRRIEMSFLPDVYVECETCKGRRYNRETLAVLYRGRTIADVLDMTVDQALDFFQHVPALKRKLLTLSEVGLGYVHLGQPATTLSGGEAQRVKLAAELARQARGHTLYILDEPTTGLHLADIERLLAVLMRLRDQGNTILVIEHNLDVIKVADHIIDLGPEGGDAGGRLVAAGTPEAIAACRRSHTGQALLPLLAPRGIHGVSPNN
ncbi:MAG: UvrABC system protein A [Lentisphaerae bacterium ADurb.BinA184]|nr:MAG: UvrABC system protein A [Lentisphaerae bacterium ADurb.BinA184]